MGKIKWEEEVKGYLQICLEDVQQQVSLFPQEWNSNHDMPHHKKQQRLAFLLFHHSPTADHGVQLENFNRRQLEKGDKQINLHNNLMHLQTIWGASAVEVFDIRQLFRCSRTNILTVTTLSVNLFKNTENIGWKASEILEPGKANRSPTKPTALRRVSSWSDCKYWKSSLKNYSP